MEPQTQASGTNSLDRAFFRLHFRSSTIISSLLGIRARQGIEKILLLLALFSFLLFTWMHINHVLFIDLSQYWGYSRYKDFLGDKFELNLINEYYKSTPVSGNSASPVHRSMPPSILQAESNFHHSTSSSSSSTTCLARLIQKWNEKVQAHSNEYDMRLLRVLIQRDNGRRNDTNATTTGIWPAASFIYTLERGLLTLPNRTSEKLGIKFETITLYESSSCLGGTLSRWALNIIGYESHVLNSLVLGTNGQGGYVLAEHSGEIHALSRASEVNRLSNNIFHGLLLKAGTLCSALFLVFSSSSLASFILAQTQQRMLRFTVALQQHVNTRRSVLPLVLTHLIDSVVFVPIILGVHFFLFEFFDDQLLAFYVILTVWTCEIWSITTCRTAESLKVFPRVFGLLMTWFHTYYLTYPFGYTFLCLITSVLGLLCCAFHLFNRYELPALQAGTISVIQPRSPSVSALLGLSVPSFLLLRRQEPADVEERRYRGVNAAAGENPAVNDTRSERYELPTTTFTTNSTATITSSTHSPSPVNIAESEEPFSSLPPAFPPETSSQPQQPVPSSNSRINRLHPIKSTKSDEDNYPSASSRNQTRADNRTRLLYGTPGRCRNPSSGLSDDVLFRRREQVTSDVTDSSSQELSRIQQTTRRKRAATESAFFDDWFF